MSCWTGWGSVLRLNLMMKVGWGQGDVVGSHCVLYTKAQGPNSTSRYGRELYFRVVD